MVGGQTGADKERTQEIIKNLGEIYVEMDPGNARPYGESVRLITSLVVCWIIMLISFTY